MNISHRYPMTVLHTQSVMNTHPALLGRKGVSTGDASRQRRQQRLGLLQVGGLKAFSEPAVDRRQQLMGLSALALLSPQPTQAHHRPQLQGVGLLAAGEIEGLRTTPLSFGMCLGTLRTAQ